MRVLVISAHPDDGVIGAGGTLIKHIKNGDKIFFCIATKPYTPDWSKEEVKKSRKEILEVCKMLRVKKTYFLDFPTVKLDTIPQKELNDKITKCVNEIRPEVVFTTHGGDLNKDHRLVFESTMVATRPMLKSPVKKVLSHETLSSTEWAQSYEKSFLPNVYVDISDVLEAKLRVLSTFKTELRRYPHPRSLDAISLHARKRGTEIGTYAAEAFMLIREISG